MEGYLVAVFARFFGHYYQLKGRHTFTSCLIIHTSRLHSTFTSTSVQFAEKLQQIQAQIIAQKEILSQKNRVLTVKKKRKKKQIRASAQCLA